MSLKVQSLRSFKTGPRRPTSNRRFQVTGAETGPAFVPWCGQDLERIFSVQQERIVNRDNTVSFAKLKLQISPTSVADWPWGECWKNVESATSST